MPYPNTNAIPRRPVLVFLTLSLACSYTCDKTNFCKGSASNAQATALILNLRASSENTLHVHVTWPEVWLLHTEFLLSSHDFMDACYNMYEGTWAWCSNICTPPLKCESSVQTENHYVKTSCCTHWKQAGINWGVTCVPLCVLPVSIGATIIDLTVIAWPWYLSATAGNRILCQGVITSNLFATSCRIAFLATSTVKFPALRLSRMMRTILCSSLASRKCSRLKALLISSRRLSTKCVHSPAWLSASIGSSAFWSLFDSIYSPSSSSTLALASCPAASPQFCCLVCRQRCWPMTFAATRFLRSCAYIVYM